MSSFHLELATPTGRLFDGDVYMVSARGTDGSLSILAGHIPFVTALVDGDIRIYSAANTVLRIGHASGGILSVSKDITRILAADFVWKE